MRLAHAYAKHRHSLHSWRYELNTLQKVMMATAFAILTGLVAQVRILTPLSVIPFTGQVFAVLLAGVILGKTWGGVSQLIYLGGGAAGIPWFSGFAGGVDVLTGLTAGYLVGFVVAAFLIGWIVESFTWTRKFTALLPLMFASIGLIYLFGACWFAAVTGLDMAATFRMAVLPFIPLDLAKALLAAGLASAVTTKKPYGPEL